MNTHQPTKAFRLSAIVALLAGTLAYLFGLFNADMQLNEKGYYFAILLYSLFSAISLQKTVRDKAENIPTSSIYYALSWASTGLAVALLIVGLYNAELLLSEKGFYGMAYTLSLFAAITVQKNVRDMQMFKQTAPKSDVQDEETN